MPKDLSYLKSVSTDVLSRALKKGATDAAVATSISQGLSVDVRLGEIETVEYCEDHGFGITVYVGQKKGTVSTSDFSDKALDLSIEKAISIAKYTAADEFAGLPDPAKIAKTWPDLDLYHPWNLEVEEAAEIAKNVEAEALGYDSKIKNSEGANVSSGESMRWYVNSSGFSGGFQSSRHSFSVSVVAESDGQLQRDYDYTTSRLKDNLDSTSKVARSAAKGAVDRLFGQQVKTQKVPVLFRSDVATGLIGSFLSAISGGSLYRKQSFLLDHLGKPIFPSFMQIEDRPFVSMGLASSPYDGEGVAVQDRKLIEAGNLQGYLLSTYSAKRLKMETTGNAGGPHNIYVNNTGQNLDALLKELGTGLFVTDVIGQGVKITTGDYSRGVTGFWVENGEIQFPVEEITVAGNLKEMFKGIQAIGTDAETRGGIEVGSILIDEMTVAGS